jgi:hypothetical protein
MAAPRYEVVQKKINNPGATMPLVLPIIVLCNTSDEDLERNIRANSARADLEWLNEQPAHARRAVIVGGGPSVEGFIEDIRAMQANGATVFAINAASRWLRTHGVIPDYQVMSDAKEETASLIDPEAKAHLLASQVNAKTMEAVAKPILWHSGIGDIEKFFPEERVRRGGYSLVGGGAATGNSALCVAYVMGYRDLHAFGFDSSHRGEASHAYDQPMNRFIPTVDVEWAGKTYTSSVAMKAQAEKFQMTAQALKQQGCTICVYGDGLLQHMYTTPPENLTERDKYRRMWQFDGYREVAPGELIIADFLEIMKPEQGNLIVDFGCGTGRASLALQQAGHEVYLIDFADNCRDDEALSLPFLEWDLCHPCPVRAPYGLCTDVMEHIPPEDVRKVIANIMASAQSVLFQVSTVKDSFGQVLGTPLHLTVRQHGWWRDLFEEMGYAVTYDSDRGIASLFAVSRKDEMQ